MLNALKRQPTAALSPTAEIEALLDRNRRALVAASTAAAVSAVISDVNGVIETIDELSGRIHDEIRQEADNIDRTRTRELFEQKNTVLQLLTEAEGLAAKAEAKHADAVKAEQDSAARALADEGTQLAADLRQLHIDIDSTISVLVDQLDRLRDGEAKVLHLRKVLGQDMKRTDLLSFRVIEEADIDALGGWFQHRDRFNALVRDHSALTAVMPYLRKLSEQMKSR